MARVRRGTKARRRRKKIMRQAKGFRGGQSRLYKTAIERVHRALAFAYRDRRVKKRDFRTLWIARIGIAAKNNGINYSSLMGSLKKKGIELNRKILSEMAIHDPGSFKQLCDMTKEKKAA